MSTTRNAVTPRSVKKIRRGTFVAAHPLEAAEGRVLDAALASRGSRSPNSGGQTLLAVLVIVAGVVCAIAFAVALAAIAVVVFVAVTASYYFLRYLLIAGDRVWAAMANDRSPRVFADPVGEWIARRTRRMRRELRGTIRGEKNAPPQPGLWPAEPWAVADDEDRSDADADGVPRTPRERVRVPDVKLVKAHAAERSRLSEMTQAAEEAWAYRDVERLRSLAVEVGNLGQADLAAALRERAHKIEAGD